jgi:outer membrane autotransporter protein
MKENILIGAAVGYEESKIKIKEHNRKGENSVKSTHLIVYGNVDLDAIELKAGLNYSALRYKANRNINIPTLAGTANAKYRGHQVHAFVEASKIFNITENYDVAPYLNVAYTEITAKDFTESGSKAALHAQGQSNNRTSVTLGVKNDWYLGTDKNLAITADLGWKHTFGDQTIDKRFNFVGSDQSFNIKSAGINRNSAVVGLGIKGQHQDFTIDVGYQGEFNNKVKDHALSAKLKWSF